MPPDRRPEVVELLAAMGVALPRVKASSWRGSSVMGLMPDEPEVLALLALMLLHGASLPAG